MDLGKAYDVDEAAVTEGTWLTTREGVDVRVAKLGNPKFVAEVSRLQVPHLARLTSSMGDVDLNRDITIEAMAKTILKDWKVTNNGEPVPYTVKLGIQALTDYPDFQEDVSSLSANRTNFKKETIAGKL